MIVAPLDSVLQFAGPTVRDGCLALLETATAGWLQTLPVVPQHGDLFLDNVLRYREEYHIVDWDSFGEIDLPFHDLVTLLFSFLHGSGAPEGWNRDLKKQIPFLVERYARRMQLPASMVSVLLPLTLANQLYLHCHTVERRIRQHTPDPAQLQIQLAARLGDDAAQRFANIGAQAVFPLIEFVTAIEGRGAASLMYAALEHYFEHVAYWQEVFLGK
jgi:Ser/Thr protein kinase RdoA (MazF antagonist)